MKKQLFGAILLSALALQACTGNGNNKGGDTTTVQRDSAVSKDEATGTDTSAAPAKGASSSAAIGGFDTSRAKLDTANTNPKK